MRARIIEVDPKKRKVILGLKPSYFEGDLAEDVDDDEEGDLDQELLEQDEGEGSDFEDELENATAGQVLVRGFACGCGNLLGDSGEEYAHDNCQLSI